MAKSRYKLDRERAAEFKLEKERKKQAVASQSLLGAVSSAAKVKSKLEAARNALEQEEKARKAAEETAAAEAAAGLQVSHGAQLQPLWRPPTAAVSYNTCSAPEPQPIVLFTEVKKVDPLLLDDGMTWSGERQQHIKEWQGFSWSKTVPFSSTSRKGRASLGLKQCLSVSTGLGNLASGGMGKEAGLVSNRSPCSKCGFTVQHDGPNRLGLSPM